MIWRRKWTLVTWIFLANRYILIALTIWGISPYTAQVGFLPLFQFNYIDEKLDWVVEASYVYLARGTRTFNLRSAFDCSCFPVIILGDVLRSAQNVVFAGAS